MSVDKRFWVILFSLLSMTIIFTACQGSAETSDSSTPEKLKAWLLVRAPDGPLPVNQPVTVRSRIEDGQGVSHVELYAAQMPTGETNVLIRSDQAPFAQTSFTASQTFTPLQQGHYVIKVVGYNVAGEWSESDFIGFDVE